MKVAALDLGTNSFLCLIAEVEKHGTQFKITRIISDEVEVVRLGQGVQQNKKFHPEALSRAKACLTKFRKTIDQHQPEKILAMATSAARDVSNPDEFFKIGEELNIPIEIIPGSKEAEITFSGSISGISVGPQTIGVIDIGGGSTEIILGSNSQIHFSQSANIGAVRITEMFFPDQPPTQEECLKAQEYISRQLEFLKNPLSQWQPDLAIAVAGTPTELAKIMIGSFDRERVDGFKIDFGILDLWLDSFMNTDSHQREIQYGVSHGRADIILAGTMILKECLKALNLQELTVSTRGVRYGVALEIAKRSL